jgi:hypothetical protein
MPSNAKSRSSRKTRNFDRQSGKNRVSKPEKDYSPPSESEAESQSDSDVESELDMPVKDDSRRQPKKDKKKKQSSQTVAVRSKTPKQKTQVFGADDDVDDDANLSEAEATGSSMAPHMLLIFGASYHMTVAPVTFPSISEFVPFTGSYYWMMHAMCDAIWGSTLVHETIPGYFSPIVFWYGGFLFYLQILRAREAAGALTRLERRVYNRLLGTYPLESWPVPTPMIGFLQALGSTKPADPMYTWITPKLPTITGFSGDHGLRGLHNIEGISRVPILPAILELVRRFGNNQTVNTDQIVSPSRLPLSDTNMFLGLNASTDADGAIDQDFATLTYNAGWIPTPETGSLVTMTDMGLKRSTIARWRLPNYGNTFDARTLEGFLGLPENAPLTWISPIQKTISALCKFFPNSTQLSMIKPTTNLASIAETVLTREPAVAAEDGWFHYRENISISATSSAGIQEMELIKVATTTQWNAKALNGTHPSAGNHVERLATGPFFVNAVGDNVSVPVTQYESGGYSDPVLRFSEIIENQLLDRNGGR